MKNGIRVHDKGSESRSEWPREVCIKQTLEAIAIELGDEYEEDDDNGLVATALMDSMTTIEIESWEEIPDGYELHDLKDYEDYQAYLESKQCKHHQESRVPDHDRQTSLPVGKIKAIDLQLGRCYHCIIDGENGPDKFNFIQLAIDPKSNRRYILVNGFKKRINDPDLVRELIKMTFQEIDSADFDGDPSFKFRRSVWPCILDDQGLLKIKSYDWYLDEFIEQI